MSADLHNGVIIADKQLYRVNNSTPRIIVYVLVIHAESVSLL